MSTFVAVGTSREPFVRLLDTIESLAESGSLPKPVKIQSGHTPFSSAHCEVIPFLEMDRFEQEVRQAKLIICQAGGGTVLLARLHGKIPVVVPRSMALGEVVDDHQLANAEALDRCGQAVAVFNVNQLAAGAERALRLQAEGGHQPLESPLVAAIRGDLAHWLGSPGHPQ